MNLRIPILVLALCLSAPSFCLESPPQGYSYHVLENGLEVLLLENPSSPMVGFNVVVKRGSIHEDWSTNGISHMLEHLLFNGTQNRSQKELYDDTDRIGGYNNANTAESYTNFMFVAPSKHFARAMEIQSDMLLQSTIPEDKFEKEKGIVLEEISKALANPRETVRRNLKTILYEDTPWSLPTLGTAATIKSLTHDQVQQVYERYYVPNNMLISVVGGFQSAQILKLLKKHYLVKPPKPLPSNRRAGSKEGEIKGYGGVKHRYYSGSKYISHLIYRLPEFQSPLAMDLIDEFLDKSADKLREKLALSGGELMKSLDFEIQGNSREQFLLASLRSSHSIPSEPLGHLKKEMESLRFSLTPRQLDAIIEQHNSSFYRNLEKPHMFGILNARQLAQSGADGLLRSLDPEEFQQAAREIENKGVLSGSILVMHHPDQEHDSTNEKQSSTKVYGKEGGMRVITRQNPMNSLLALHFLFGHKAHYEAKYGKNAAWILHDCLSQRLKEIMPQHKDRGFGFLFKFNDSPFIPMDDIYLDPDFGYIRAEALDQDFQKAIPWLSSQIHGFLPTREEYDRALANHHRSFASHQDPSLGSSVFSRVRKELIYDFPKLDDPPELNFENLKSFAGEYFSPGNLVLSIVSSRNHDEIISLFPKLNSDPKSTVPPRYRKSIKSQTAGKPVQKEGKGQRAYLFGGFTQAVLAEEKPALTALSLLISEQINFQIREKKGMAYGISSGIEILGNQALFYLRLGTRPENIETLSKIWPGFFRPDVLKDVDKAAFEKAINKYLGRMSFRRLSSINQGFYLGKSLYQESDPFYFEKLLERIAQLDLSAVQKTAAKYLSPENSSELIVRPSKP